MRLTRKKWSIDNHRALSALLQDVPAGQIAVFDWDDTCIHGDCGEAFFHFQLHYGLLPTGPEISDSLPVEIDARGRRLLLELGEAGGPAFLPAGKKKQYRELAAFLLQVYRQLELGASGPAAAYSWVIAFLAGFSPAEVSIMARRSFRRQLRLPLSTFSTTCKTSGRALTWRRGIRVFPEMRNLAAVFRRAGLKVYLVSATQPLIVAAAALEAGFQVDGVIGMAGETDARGLLTGRLDPAYRVNYGLGKVANIDSFLGFEPVFVAGDSLNDLPMLTAYPGTRVRLLIAGERKPELEPFYLLAAKPGSGALIQGVDLAEGSFSPEVPNWL